MKEVSFLWIFLEVLEDEDFCGGVFEVIFFGFAGFGSNRDLGTWLDFFTEAVIDFEEMDFGLGLVLWRLGEVLEWDEIDFLGEGFFGGKWVASESLSWIVWTI